MTPPRSGVNGAGFGLESMASCFQGLIPATLFTCALDGTPNAAFLSHVDYVDPTHVALSFQFFNKSRRNIAENPHALVRLFDPDTSQGWRLRLRYVRSETSGPVFDRMNLRIEAIASYSGLKGIFKLLAADIYEVVALERAEDEHPRTAAAAIERRSSAADPVFTMKALQDMSDRIQRADSLERLLDSILEGLEESFGFAHSMILLPSHEEGVFVTIASRGYPENGAGAEARIGEGIIGVVAEARKPIRIAGLIRELLYAYAVHKRAQEAGIYSPDRQIPLPGLPNPESQLGVPASGTARTGRRAVHRKRDPCTAFTRKTRPRSSFSGDTWQSPFRTCSCASGRKPRPTARHRRPKRARRPTRAPRRWHRGQPRNGAKWRITRAMNAF